MCRLPEFWWETLAATSTNLWESWRQHQLLKQWSIWDSWGTSWGIWEPMKSQIWLTLLPWWLTACSRCSLLRYKKLLYSDNGHRFIIFNIQTTCVFLLPQLLKSLMTKTDNTVYGHYIFMDNEFSLPTSTGVPLRIALSGTFTPGIKGGLKLASDMVIIK